MRRRPWVEQGYGGAAYTNVQRLPVRVDDTADHPLPGGVLNDFPGGSQVSHGWIGPAFGVPARAGTGLLAQVEPIFPGVTAAYTGVAYRDFWRANPWSRRAYTRAEAGSIHPSSARGPRPRATSTSPANTPLTSSDTSTARSSQVNGRPRRSPSPDPTHGIPALTATSCDLRTVPTRADRRENVCKSHGVGNGVRSTGSQRSRPGRLVAAWRA